MTNIIKMILTDKFLKILRNDIELRELIGSKVKKREQAIYKQALRKSENLCLMIELHKNDVKKHTGLKESEIFEK